MARKSCRPCPKTRHCAKRKGSPRFSATCKNQFKSCMKGELKATGSMRSAGKACMQVLHQCQTKNVARAYRPKKRR
jgi:hypothetical protein